MEFKPLVPFTNWWKVEDEWESMFSYLFSEGGNTKSKILIQGDAT